MAEEFIIPKIYLKRKNVYFYKAFIMDNCDEMTVNTEIDIFSLTLEAAIQHMINSMTMEEVQYLIGKEINFLEISIDKQDIMNKPILSNGDPYFKDDSMAITLNGKMFKIDLIDKHLTELEVDVNPKNDIKQIKFIKMH